MEREKKKFHFFKSSERKKREKDIKIKEIFVANLQKIFLIYYNDDFIKYVNEKDKSTKNDIE